MLQTALRAKWLAVGLVIVSSVVGCGIVNDAEVYRYEAEPLLLQLNQVAKDYDIAHQTGPSVSQTMVDATRWVSELEQIEGGIQRLSVPGDMNGANTTFNDSVIDFKTALIDVKAYLTQRDHLKLVDARVMLIKSNQEEARFLQEVEHAERR